MSAVEPSDVAGAPRMQGRRVHWLELLFDLVMVVYIGEVADTMHGDPGARTALVFALLLGIAWWAWINASITMSLFGARVTPFIWVSVITAMIAVGFMAAAVPDALGSRAAGFALANVAIRVVWMLPWFLKRRVSGVPWWRPLVYSLVPAALWLVSIAAGPWRWVVWLAAIAVEIVLLIRLGGGESWLRRTVDVDHLIERVSLLVVIVFGESVLSVITELDAAWAPLTWLAALLAFVAIALLAWTFFTYAPASVERGLHRLQQRGSVSGLRDTVMYLPLVLIAGVTLFAAGLGTAVGDAGGRLPGGATACLSVGVSLFFVATSAEALRYGAGWRAVVMWGPAGIVLPWLLVPVAAVAPAWAVVAVAVVVLCVSAALSAINARRLARTAVEE